MISEDEFNAFESVRCSGVTNMFAINNVVKLSGLSREKVLEIMKSYGKLKAEYGVA